MSRLRLFVAVYPPEATVVALLEALRALEPDRHRETPADQVHLTLLFIGSQPVRELDQTIESIERSASGIKAFELQPERLMTLPSRRPRLIACRTSAPPGLLEVQRRLAHRLAHNPSKKPYLPHLTLHRFRHGAPRREVNVTVDAAPFLVSEIRLMKSTLHPDGACHDVVESFPFDS